MCLGKGQWLARRIQFLQKKRSQTGALESQSVMNTSEYFSDDECDDSFHTSLDDGVYSAFEDMESDGKSHSFIQSQLHLLVLSAMTNCSLGIYS